tara:strand:+ start:221 stop:727 length:507 start_codon:yes stop_codon:yes gene_type:complete
MLKHKTVKYKCKTVKPKESIKRFVEAHENGWNNGERTGCTYKVALQELNNTGIKKKSEHYIWYVFPQPKFNPGMFSRLSKTTKHFFISDSQTVDYINNIYLRRHLLKTLTIINTRFNSNNAFNKYFNVDYGKFKSFVNHFHSIFIQNPTLKKYSKLGKLLKNIKDNIN